MNVYLYLVMCSHFRLCVPCYLVQISFWVQFVSWSLVLCVRLAPSMMGCSKFTPQGVPECEPAVALPTSHSSDPFTPSLMKSIHAIVHHARRHTYRISLYGGTYRCTYNIHKINVHVLYIYRVTIYVYIYIYVLTFTYIIILYGDICIVVDRLAHSTGPKRRCRVLWLRVLAKCSGSAVDLAPVRTWFEALGRYLGVWRGGPWCTMARLGGLWKSFGVSEESLRMR